MPKPEKYDNPAERPPAWTRLHSNPDFVQFFLGWWIQDKIDKKEKELAYQTPPDRIEAGRAYLNALIEIQNESSAQNFTTPK